MQVNDPQTLSELRGLHNVCEQASRERDGAVLTTLYWNPADATGYGARTLNKVEITAFGTSAGLVDLEFSCVTDGMEKHGRQTQFWIRMAEGWRMVADPVSFLPSASAFPEAASLLLGLEIPAASRGPVQESLDQLGSMARFLMQFPLPQEIEAAPVFHP